MEPKRIVVIHPFQQHSFRTAIAINEAGMLQKYVTTVYNKKGSWTNRLQFLLSSQNRVRSAKRKTNDLLDDSIQQFCEIRSLLLLLLQRIDKTKKIYNWYFRHVIRIFNSKVYRYLVQNKPDAVIVYDTLSADLIRKIRNAGLDVKIIMDMSAPYYNFMEEEFHKDYDRNPEYSSEMVKMLNSSIYAYRRDYSRYEIHNVDFFLVASEFTRKSLLTEIDNDKIYSCVYGIDDFAEINKTSIEEKRIILPIKVIFVGRVNQVKGAFFAIKCAKLFSDKEVEFHFYGSYDPQSEVVLNAPVNCVFHGHIPRQDMKKVYHNSDILVLPSLADGFGFVVPEALSHGVPVICTKNVGASQLINDGKNGFVFNVGNAVEFELILRRVIDNPEQIVSMRKNAINSVMDLTWSNYNHQVRMAINDVFEKNKK